MTPFSWLSETEFIVLVSWVVIIAALIIVPRNRRPGSVADLRRVEADFLRRSKELTAEEWERRWLPGRLLDNLARLTAALQ